MLQLLFDKTPIVFGLACGFYLVMIAAAMGGRIRLRQIFDHPRSPSTGQAILALDGLRGIAILMVVMFHLFQWFNPVFGNLGLFALFRNGWSGVELFVILSGYLIYSSLQSGYGKPFWLQHYAKRRLFRIYPVLLVTTLVCALLALHSISPFTWHLARFREGHTISAVAELMVKDLFLVRSFNWLVPEVLNPPSWSLGVELSYYLLIPLFVIAFRKQRLMAVVMILGALFTAKRIDIRELGIFYFFFVGILLYELDRSPAIRQGRVWFWIFLILGLALFARFLTMGQVDLEGHHLYPRHYRTGWLAAGLFLIVLSVLKLPTVNGWLSFYPLRFVGIVSYSLFLWHFPLFAVSGLESLPHMEILNTFLVATLYVLPACLFLSACSYFAIERPFLKRA